MTGPPDPRSGVHPDGTWVPAFEGQRPPLQPGHEVTLKHGAYSARRTGPRAQELVALLLEQARLPRSRTAYLADPAFLPALQDYATLRARKSLVEQWLDENGGDLDAKGQVRAATQLLARLDAQVAAAQRELGLTPAARARLGRDVAMASQGGLDLTEGRRLRLEAERRQALLAGEGPPDDEDEEEVL